MITGHKRRIAHVEARIAALHARGVPQRAAKELEALTWVLSTLKRAFIEELTHDAKELLAGGASIQEIERWLACTDPDTRNAVIRAIK